MSRYSVKCDKKYLEYISKKKINNLELKSELLVFECNNVKQFSEIELVEVLDLYSLKVNKLIKEYLITIIGFIILILMLIPVTKTVTEIKFVKEETYNEDVYNFVEGRLKKVWLFAFLDEDITKINKDIRSVFYEYQWINIEKEGTKVLINISDDDTLNNETNIEKPKSLYSKYNSIVEGYFVEKGTINVKVGHSVSQGDLLIDGHVKMYNDKLEEVPAKGYVYGKVIEEKKINVLKKEEKIERTGKLETHNIYVLFGNSLNNPIPSFNNYEAEYENLYSFGNSIIVRKVIYYEIATITNVYSKDDAVDYGKSLIEKEFKNEKKYDFEEIIEIKILSIVDNEYDYEITYQMVSLRDLCE